MGKRSKKSGGDAIAELREHGEVRSAVTLLVVFGDQLDRGHPGLAMLEKDADAVLMMEVDAETEEGPSHKARTALFFAAMRHYGKWLVDGGYRVRYVTVDHKENTQSFDGEVGRAVEALGPARIVVMRPGDWRVMEMVEGWEGAFGVEVEVLEDPHFLTTPAEFSEWADGRKQLTMEYWYRERRRAHGYLMDGKGKPVGGEWNYDKDNRESFDRSPKVKRPYRPRVDGVVSEVIELVNARYGDAPGVLDEKRFVWPVTREQALRALDDFVENRLDMFGPYEDAMWDGEWFLYHSALSSALNLHLLDPRECCEKAIAAYEAGKARLNSVEGFVRQLIGWREYIRGVYWHEGAGYRDRNFLDQHGKLPGFYWDGESDMRCVSECAGSVVEHGWSHHIPRLMVLANFAMIAGVGPRAIGDWFYGMYVDSVDWATTPNTIGMGMHCDGVRGKGGNVERLPVVGTKPYAASGKYIDRMSNYCGSCAYNVKKRTGEDACPFNVFYWDFLIRNRELFSKNQRMNMIVGGLKKWSDGQITEITVSADRLRERMGIGAIGGAA